MDTNMDLKLDSGLNVYTLYSGIDIGQGISVEPWKIDKNIKRWALMHVGLLQSN